MKKYRFLLSLSLAVLIALTAIQTVRFVQKPLIKEEFGNSISLSAPAFLQVAKASASFDLATKLDAEAGIAAYYKTSSTITLSQVRPQFRTIELETTDYIIGSVPVPNYIEQYDVHMYVHKDGWILAYYLRDNPLSKIVDTKAQKIDTTNLKAVVSLIAGAAGAPFSDVSYYDFRYPNATNILIVAEDRDNGTDFTINMPSTYAYFERGWAAYNYNSCNSSLIFIKLDGTDYWASKTYGDTYNGYGVINGSQLTTDTTHTFEVGSCIPFGALIVEYRVP